jgi:hypothetical protein
MATKQGDVALLNDPVAQQLLQATSPAKLAYTWTDGTPRLVPIGFHWDGRQIVLGTPPHAPKMAALTHNPKVALTIDTNEFPYRVLLIRGVAALQLMDRIADEYALMARRCLGPGADGWLQQVAGMLPSMGGMVRIAITPEWVGILDFEQRFPSAIEHAMAAAITP